MFDFFKKKKISVWPSKASDSASSLGLLTTSLGYPFTGWKVPDMELSDYEENVIKPACHCNQLFTYRYLYEDNLLGEIMLGCALAIAKEAREDLIEYLDFGVFTLEEILKIIATDAVKDKNPINIVMSRFALLWEMRMCDGDNKDEKYREKLREKIYSCLFHSRNQAINAFDPMISNISDYNLDEIEQLTYRRKRSIFEEVLYKRSNQPNLFRHMPLPNAQLLLEARRKEYQTALDAEDTKQNCFIKLKKDMESCGSDSKLLYDKFCEFLNVMDDLRLELKLIGGEYCDSKLVEITDSRNDIFDSMTKVFVEYEESFSDLMSSLRNNYDSTYTEMENDLGIFKYIDTKEIPSFALTLSDEIFIKLKDTVSKEEMESYLVTNMIDILLDGEEREEVYRKVNLLS